MTNLHIILVNGGTIKIEMPAEFDFPAWVRAVRADGYIMGPKIYIAWNTVVAVLDESQLSGLKPPGATMQ